MMDNSPKVKQVKPGRPVDEIREENDKKLSVLNQSKTNKRPKLQGKKLHPLDHKLAVQPKDKTITKLGNTIVSRYIVP